MKILIKRIIFIDTLFPNLTISDFIMEKFHYRSFIMNKFLSLLTALLIIVALSMCSSEEEKAKPEPMKKTSEKTTSDDDTSIENETPEQKKKRIEREEMDTAMKDMKMALKTRYPTTKKKILKHAIKLLNREDHYKHKNRAMTISYLKRAIKTISLKNSGNRIIKRAMKALQRGINKAK